MGRAYCWGYNFGRELGIGDTTYRVTVPKLVSNLPGAFSLCLSPLRAALGVSTNLRLGAPSDQSPKRRVKNSSLSPGYHLFRFQKLS